MPAQEYFERVRWLLDSLFPSPIFLIILTLPLVIGIGLRLASFLIKSIGALPPDPFEAADKPKWEQPVSFFDPPDNEPDYVVGFGDDGEMIYGSEKPKRKNDEVD